MRPRDEVGKVRKALALDQLVDLVAIDKRLKDIGTQIKTVIAETRTSVTDVRGVGPVVAAIVLGEVRRRLEVPDQAPLRRPTTAPPRRPGDQRAMPDPA